MVEKPLLCHECDSECDYYIDFLCFEYDFAGIDSGCDFYKVFMCYTIEILGVLLIVKKMFVQNRINYGDAAQFGFKLVRVDLCAVSLVPVLNVKNGKFLPFSTMKFDHRNIRKILILCSFGEYSKHCLVLNIYVVVMIVFYVLYYGNG